MPTEYRPDECDWFDACEQPSTGMAAHPDKGVIPICRIHVEEYRLPLITKNESE